MLSAIRKIRGIWESSTSHQRVDEERENLSPRNPLGIREVEPNGSFIFFLIHVGATLARFS